MPHLSVAVEWSLAIVCIRFIKHYRPARTCQNRGAQPRRQSADLERSERAGSYASRDLTPYDIYSLLLDKPDPAGLRLAWYVARNYNYDHLQDRRMVNWHISGEALTVWLTRHWSSDELLAKALEIRQSKVKP